MSPALGKLEQEIRAISGEQAVFIRRGFLRAEQTWEKFFWARVAHHLASGKAPDEVLALADEDILALSTLLHPL